MYMDLKSCFLCIFGLTIKLGLCLADDEASFLYDEVDGQDVVVATKYGSVLGRRKHFTNDNVGGVTNKVDHFLGVPYAQPPVGNLRFAPPRSRLPWRNIYEAVRSAHVCPQNMNYYSYAKTATVSEDCLYLNIYSPYEDLRENKLYPVMYYIHGGSYTAGGAVASPARALAQHGVVVVVINYRLGIIGFMTTGNDDFPGNYGLLDMIQSLKWVKQNIASFRGDPQRVTIFGNSAGGGAVGLLSVSPQAKGLFKYAIAQSGSIASAWSVLRRTVDMEPVTFNIGKQMGCDTNSSSELLSCLRTKPWTDFQSHQYSKPSSSPLGLQYVPRVDGDILPDYPEPALDNLNINPAAFMTGVTEDEMSRNLNYFVWSEMQGDRYAVDNIHRGLSREVKDKVLSSLLQKSYFWSDKSIQVLLHEYTDYTRINDTLLNRKLAAQALSDLMMNAPMIKTAEKIAKRKVPVYIYVFSYQEAAPPYNLASEDWWRNTSYHILDMNYVFGSVFDNVNIENGEKQEFTEDDRKLSRKVMKLWTDFARTGNPTPHSQSWETFEPNVLNYYDIDLPEQKMKQHYRTNYMNFWNKLIYEIEDNADFMNANSTVKIVAPSPVPVILICVVVILAVLVLFLLGIILFIRFRGQKGLPTKTISEPCQI